MVIHWLTIVTHPICHTQLSQLIERTREQNIIIQSLHDKFTKQLQAPQSTKETKQANAFS